MRRAVRGWAVRPRTWGWMTDLDGMMDLSGEDWMMESHCLGCWMIRVVEGYFCWVETLLFCTSLWISCMALYWARVFFLMILCIRLGKNFLYYHYELLWTSLACCMRIPCTMGWAYESAVRQFSYFYHAVLKQQQERRGRLFWPYLIPVTFQSMSSWTKRTYWTNARNTMEFMMSSSVFNDVK